MSDTVLLPGARDVRATLDTADRTPANGEDATSGTNASEDAGTDDSWVDAAGPGGDVPACVVACPPHPQMGGVRSDRRLTATSDALGDRGIDCLRFDYGEWDEGYGEREDARNALRWAAERYDAVGIYGYSFGGAVAILAVASVDVPVAAASVLAPASRLANDLDSGEQRSADDSSGRCPLDAAAAVDDLPCPLQVGFGERDETADSGPVVEAAERAHQSVVPYASDHHFVGQHDDAAADAADFLATHLQRR